MACNLLSRAPSECSRGESKRRGAGDVQALEQCPVGTSWRGRWLGGCRAEPQRHVVCDQAAAAAAAAATAAAAAADIRAAAIAVDGSHVCTNGPARLGIAGLTSRQITHVPVCAVSAGPLPRWRRMSSRKDCRRRGGINAWIAACRHERGYGRRWWR